MKESTLNNIAFKKGRSTSCIIVLLPICLLLVIAGCKAKKQLVVKPVKVDTMTKTTDPKIAKLNALRASQTDFDTFSGKARTHLDISGNSNDVTLTIRIKKDQKIWVSVTAIAGIEVARALITPDSILLINRLQNLYVKQPFAYVNKFAGNEVNYKTIESLLIGNAIPELLTENADLKTDPANITLTGNLNDIVFKLVAGPQMKAVQTNLDDAGAGQSLQVTNGAFIEAGTRLIPSQIDIASLVKNKKIQVNLRYVKSDFNVPLDFPFTIPSRYKEAN
jgi:hypothetical protein